MTIPYFKAKLLYSENFVEGFYCTIPETTYCIEEDYKKFKVKMRHFLITTKTTDWGLPNELRDYEIDFTTLKQIGWYEPKNEYYTGCIYKWFDREENE